MFTFQRKESPALQIYGKLPLAKDYLRVGCGEGGGRVLREWLDQAFSTAAEGGAAPRLAYPMRFLAGDRWTGTPLQGCAWPSSDSGGLRPFPLFMFVERKKRALLEDVDATFAPADAWWAAIEALWPTLTGFADGQSFLAGMRGRRVELEAPEPGAESARVDFERWIAALWPAEGRSGLARSLDLVRKLKPAPVRLPLVSDLPMATQVHAWWKALQKIGYLRDGETPTLFYPQAGASAAEPAFVLLFPGVPGPRDAAWLTSALGATEPREGDFSSAEPRNAGPEAVAAESAPPLADSVRGAIVTLSASG